MVVLLFVGLRWVVLGYVRLCWIALDSVGLHMVEYGYVWLRWVALCCIVLMLHLVVLGFVGLYRTSGICCIFGN